MDKRRFLLDEQDRGEYVLTTYSHDPHLFDRNSQDLIFHLEPDQQDNYTRLLPPSYFSSLYSKQPFYKYVVVPKIDSQDFLHKYYMYSTLDEYSRLLQEVISLGYSTILVNNPDLDKPRYLTTPIWNLVGLVEEKRDYIVYRYELYNQSETLRLNKIY